MLWGGLIKNLRVRESHCVRPLVDDPLMLLNSFGENLMWHFRIKANNGSQTMFLGGRLLKA